MQAITLTTAVLRLTHSVHSDLDRQVKQLTTRVARLRDNTLNEFETQRLIPTGPSFEDVVDKHSAMANEAVIPNGDLMIWAVTLHDFLLNVIL